MKSGIRDMILVGGAAGLVCFVHWLIPGAYLFPLVWPLLAGASVKPNKAPQPDGGGFSQIVRHALVAGLASAVVFVIAAIGALYLSSRIASSSLTGHPVPSSDTFFYSSVINTLVIAFVGMPGASLIGACIRRFMPPRER